ncbi:hypothetical protein CLSAB_19020 [Clostridium saccharobutylicum]|uniref:hypothetical protein n=1 Tax=Clostridium saccharobutylicum TaxID=169679 RepID=UPI0009C7E3FC|nr:hypothetical protein [Clostridium saccharobutylicum]OOM17182.1 hypothetical protein CLSAB_19020 [Clostridium saccharobutylicum]
MNKLEIAQEINFKGNLFRTIRVSEKFNLKVGEIYNNQNRIESWCTQYGSYSVPQFHGEYEYFFRIKNAEGHEVDYENEEECEALGAVDCEDECEVLVLPTQKFKIVSISEGFEDVGYCEVELEVAE